MPKSASERETKITVNIKPVKLAELTPRQLQLVRRFWSRLLAQVQNEVKPESEAKREQ